MDHTILASAQTGLIRPDRVTGETKAFTSQCKLRKGHDGIRNYDAHRIICSARIMDSAFFQRLF